MKNPLTAIAILIGLNGFGQTTDSLYLGRAYCPAKGLHLFVSYHAQKNGQTTLGNMLFHYDAFPSNWQLKQDVVATLLSGRADWVKGGTVVILTMIKLTPFECKRLDISN